MNTSYPDGLMMAALTDHSHTLPFAQQPDNILLEENKAINQIKIIDFGLSVNLVGEEEKAEATVVDGRIKERRGTMRHAHTVGSSSY